MPQSKWSSPWHKNAGGIYKALGLFYKLTPWQTLLTYNDTTTNKSFQLSRSLRFWEHPSAQYWHFPSRLAQGFLNLYWLTSCDCISEFARQYEVDKNTAQAVNRLTRKLADITNDNDGNNSSSRAKRQRVRHESPPADTDDKDMHTNGSRAGERFVYQAGHKFFPLCAPWIRSGDNLFDLDVDEDYDVADRFKDDENKAQGQLWVSSGRLSTSSKRSSRCSPCVRGGFDSR